jgi:RNA polymerase sigma-32 factor
MNNLNAEKYISSASAPNLSFEEEKALFVTLGDEKSTELTKQQAVDKICLSHIRFVSDYAHHYAKQCPMDMQDLVGAGVEGIMDAMDRFDVERGHRFATYCGWWIKLRMIRCIQKNHPLSMSQSMRDSVTKLQKIIREADGDLSRDDLKKSLKVNEKKLSDIEKARDASNSVFSIQTKVKVAEEGDCSYEDILPDSAETPSEIYEHSDLLQCLHEILQELDEKTQEIVMSACGEKKVRLQDLADKYGVSPERIRQLRVEATREVKLRLMDKRA